MGYKNYLRLRNFAILASAAAGGKACLITLADEWPEVNYALRKLFHRDDHSNKVPSNYTEDGLEYKRPRVVVIGSGWASISLIQKLDPALVDVKVISPRSYFFYTPLLAGVSTGSVGHSSITESIRTHTSRFGDDSYLRGNCVGVDFDNKTIKVQLLEGDQSEQLLPPSAPYLSGAKSSSSSSSSSPPSPPQRHTTSVNVPYDTLVVAIGAQTNTFGIPGVSANALYMKDLGDALALQRRMLNQLERGAALLAAGAKEGEIDEALHWIVVGGGPTGVEVTAEICDFINEEVATFFPTLKGRVKVTLVEGTSKLLGMFDPAISEYAATTLRSQGATILLNSPLSSATARTITIAPPAGGASAAAAAAPPLTVPHGLLVWSGGIAPLPLTLDLIASVRRRTASEEEGTKSCRQAGAARPPRGLPVNPDLSVSGLEGRGVYAIGDCAEGAGPPTAQAAYQQGFFLGRILREKHWKRYVGGDKGDDVADDESKRNIFKMVNYGSLAYVGGGKGVADLKVALWDHHPRKDGGVESEAHTILNGGGAFAIWRSLYFAKLLSTRNRAQVLFDWLQVAIFGRDISTPYINVDEHKPPTPPPQAAGVKK